MRLMRPEKDVRHSRGPNADPRDVRAAIRVCSRNSKQDTPTPTPFLKEYKEYDPARIWIPIRTLVGVE